MDIETMTSEEAAHLAASAEEYARSLQAARHPLTKKLVEQGGSRDERAGAVILKASQDRAFRDAGLWRAVESAARRAGR